MVSIQRRLTALLMTFMLGIASMPASAEEMHDDQVNQRPTALAMFGDAVLARPMLLAGTLIGTGIFVVSLPFSALGGNVKEAADTLVVGIAKSTFTRCLGCTDTQNMWKGAQTAEQTNGQPAQN